MMNTLKKPEELPDVTHYITVNIDELGLAILFVDRRLKSEKYICKFNYFSYIYCYTSNYTIFYN